MKMLLLDGGGVFGRVQSRILAESGCIDKFDAFAGTSIGSPQVLAIALGKSEMVVPEFFDKWMPRVFHTTWLRRINVLTSKYPDAGLNKALQSVFGSATFGQVRKPVFITAADIGRKTLKVFSSVNFDDASWPAWEVCRCATAAETYFQPWKGFADGGIYANNPSMVGLAAAVRVLKAKIEEMEILSIGTGNSSGVSDPPPRTRLGTGFWVVEAMLNGAANQMHEYFVKSMPIKRCVRIQFIRDPSWKMDDPKAMYYAERRWALEIQDAIKLVKEF